MTIQIPTARVLRDSICRYARYTLGRDWENLTPRELYLATALAIREVVIECMLASEHRARDTGAKHVYYLSLEFLLGRVLVNNLLNLGLHEVAEDALAQLGVDLESIAEVEIDPALGNGGLGRLAACFLDSMATLGLAGYGYGINYEFGLFRQAFKNGAQEEQPDEWRPRGTPWLIQRPDLARRVPLYGSLESTSAGKRHRWVGYQEVIGTPADLPIVGYGGRAVNHLRLFAAQASEEFDMAIFNAGDYLKAVEQKIQSERISKVLYPADTSAAGRELRLIQEYFFVSCAIGDVFARHVRTTADARRLPERCAIQLNDTHPALAVAELMRLLVDEHELPFDEAFDVTRRTVSYTNHTLLPEALERWPVGMLGRVLPRHLQMIFDVNERFLEDVERRWPGDRGRQRATSLIDEEGERHVRMAHLAIVGSHAVNGVSRLHTDLLVRRLAPDFAELWPERFVNQTNGVTQRRWLLKANRPLADLLTRLVGPRWITDLEALRGLEQHLDDGDVLADFRAIKALHKESLARLVRETTGVTIDPDAALDVHAKRIHEYKRQLLNALRIAHEYLVLVEDGVPPVMPRTYAFAGKAAPGYHAAKQIIRLIHALAEVVNADPRTRDWMRVVFLPNYNVSLAERIIPATDLSEHVSTAGTEASGTGNMKFMMNGGMIVGTLDGANVEILEQVGRDDIFLFGLEAEEVEAKRRAGYSPRAAAAADPRVARVLDALKANRFSPRAKGAFDDVVAGLLDWDPFFVLADLGSFLDLQPEIARRFADADGFARSCLKNVAHSGAFSSDRTIRGYAEQIWGIKVV